MNWNLSIFYPNFNEWQKDYDEIKKDIESLEQFKGKLGDFNSFKTYFLKQSEISKKIGGLYEYPALAYNLDLKNNDLASKTGNVQYLFTLYGQKTSWESPEVIKLGHDKVISFIDSDKALEPFRFSFESLFRLQSHVLDDSGEDILANFNSISDFADLYNALAISDSKNKTVKLSTGEETITDGNWRSKIADSKNASDRQIIFEAAFSKYQESRNTYAGIYSSVLKSNWSFAKSRGYSSCLNAFLFKNNVPENVFNSLIETTGQYNEGLKRYYEIRRKYFGLEKHHTYDRFLTMASSNTKYTYEEAKEIFFKSISQMPEEFISFAHDVTNEGYVDVLEKSGKQTGAFSSGVYGFPPFILLNFDGTLDSVFTLAHEAGHSIHTSMSNKYQPQETADYTIFVAEIASTFNEHMLLDYLIKNASTKEEKLVLLEQAINDICATFYRQALFADYEKQAHEMIEKGETITADVLSNIMINLYNKYYNINITEENGKENVWAYIPHLTKTPFYVYQYATSYSASLKLYENIKTNQPNAMENYLGLLKSGGSDYPVNLVKKAGVDLTTTEPFMAVVRRLDSLLDELEKSLT